MKTTAIDYSDAAATYAQHRRVHPGVIRSLLGEVGPESQLLEVGCGTGNYHLRDRLRYSFEAARILRPGGKVCIVTDSEWVIRNRQPLARYFPDTVSVDLARYPTLAELKSTMTDAGFGEFDEQNVEFAGELNDIGPFRDKAYSCLRLIPDGAFRRGIARMEKDLQSGPIAWLSRYSLLWCAKPANIMVAEETSAAVS